MASARELPSRATRGKRMQAMIDDDEAQADNEFWDQEFFAEEARDEEYKTESESEDVPDSDFDESESAGDESGDDEPQEKRKKAMKPPGAPPARKPAPKKPPPAAKAAPASSGGDGGSPPADDGGDGAKAAAPPPSKRVRISSPSPGDGPAYQAPSLRRSTKQRTEDAEAARHEKERVKPRRRAAAADVKLMTQDELLAEAARTEVENLASLKLMVAREEETKRRATAMKKRYTGPSVRWRSRGVPAPDSAEAAAAAAAGSGLQEGGSDGGGGAAAGEAAADGAGDAALGQAVAGISGAGQAADPQPQPEGGTAADAGQDAAGAADGAAEAAAQPAALQRVEASFLQPLNVKVLPRWLRPRRAAPQPSKPLCAVTGAPARYCDPLTRQYFSTVEAFKELRRRAGRPLAAPAAEAAGGADAAGEGAPPAGSAIARGGVLFGTDADAQQPADGEQAPQQLYTDGVMALVMDLAQQRLVV